MHHAVRLAVAPRVTSARHGSAVSVVTSIAGALRAQACSRARAHGLASQRTLSGVARHHSAAAISLSLTICGARSLRGQALSLQRVKLPASTAPFAQYSSWLAPSRGFSSAPAPSPSPAPTATPTPAPPRAVASAAAKPRASGDSTRTRRRKRVLLPSLLLGGPIAFLLLMIYRYGSVEAALRELREEATAVWEYVTGTRGTNPSAEELQRALGAPMPDGYIAVILALENVIMEREWDRRYGWRVRLRPGVKEMFQKLAEQGCMITLWSEHPSSFVLEFIEKMAKDLHVQAPFSQLHLGSEHCFTRESDGRKEKHIDGFNRSDRTILLVDAQPLTERVNPNNAVIIKGLKEAEAEAKAAVDAGREAPPDIALQCIVSLVTQIRADMQATGRVDVPRTLARVKREAAANGFSTDAAGVFAYMQVEAEAEARRERERLNSGVGGVARRTLSSSALFAGKMSVAEVAAVRPAARSVVTNEDSLIARTVAKQEARLASMMGPRPGDH